MPKPSSRVSRRDFARLLTGTAAGAVATAAGCAPSEKTPMPNQSTAPKPLPAETTDPSALAKQLNVTLTPEQSKALPRAVKDLQDTLATLRKYPLQDGGGEPGTLFTPVPDRR